MNRQDLRNLKIATQVLKGSSLLQKLYYGVDDACLIDIAEKEFTLLKNSQSTFLLKPKQLGFDPVKREASIQFDLPEYYTSQELVDFDLAQKLKLLIKLVKEIDAIHHDGFVLTGLNKHCIFVSKTDQSVSIVNSRLFVHLNEPILQTDYAGNRTDSAYIAPEVAGEIAINALDHRTDYYSVGMFFYEILSGALLNSDQARPCDVDTTGIESVFVDIIFKLTHRFPHHRYQSSTGIEEDLLSCLNQYSACGKIKYFLPGTNDRSDRFLFKEYLYGRQPVVSRIVEQFETISHLNKSQFIVLNGSAGVGKSSLIREVLNQIQKRYPDVIVASGKNDQIFETHYSSIIQIFKALFERIRQDQILNWDTILNKGLSPYGKLIVTILPETEALFESQPVVPAIEPIRDKQRFHYLLKRFIQLIVEVTKVPLILFIDDLQWADEPTLEFLKILSLQEPLPILILGTCRPCDKGGANRLFRFLKDSEVQDGFQQMTLNGLLEEDVFKLVQDLFQGVSEEDCGRLTSEVYKRTNGNPFVLKQFFLNAWEQKTIIFDSHTHKWHWNLAKIKETPLDTDIAALVIDRIASLSQSSQQLLKIAAIMGYRFNLKQLSTICEQDPFNVSLSLWSALQENFIIEVPTHSKLGNDFDGSEIYYAFLHDRIQSTFYSMIEPGLLAGLHYKIAKQLLSTHQFHIFEVSNHLILGKSSITNIGDKIEDLNICYEAGIQAQQASAFDSAFKHFKFCSELVLESHSDEIVNPKQRFMIQLARAETEYLCGFFDEAIAHFEALKATTTDLFDRTLLERKTINLYTNTANYKQAILEGIGILKRLGISVPENPTKIENLLRFNKAKKHLKKKVDNLPFLPPMKDQKILEATQIISQLLASAYFSNLPLFSFLISTLVFFSTEYGHTPCASFGYISYATILTSTFDEYKLSAQLGAQAMAIQQKEDNPDTDAKLYFMYGAFIGRWQQSLRECISYFDKGHDLGLKNGDINFINYSIATRLFTLMAVMQQNFCKSDSTGSKKLS